MLINEGILEGCIAGRRDAQNVLYQAYAPVMLGVCLRYARSRDEAEDILSEAFFKIFQNIKSYRNEGSFEGWMRKIIVNHALNYYRRNIRSPYVEQIEEIRETEILKDSPQDGDQLQFRQETLLCLIQNLPPGYRMVVNLYVFEEYSHKEISEMLNIAESTSKSQFLKARRYLRKRLVELNLISNAESDNEPTL